MFKKLITLVFIATISYTTIAQTTTVKLGDTYLEIKGNVIGDKYTKITNTIEQNFAHYDSELEKIFISTVQYKTNDRIVATEAITYKLNKADLNPESLVVKKRTDIASSRSSIVYEVTLQCTNINYCVTSTIYDSKGNDMDNLPSSDVVILFYSQAKADAFIAKLK